MYLVHWPVLWFFSAIQVYRCNLVISGMAAQNPMHSNGTYFTSTSTYSPGYFPFSALYLLFGYFSFQAALNAVSSVAFAWIGMFLCNRHLWGFYTPVPTLQMNICDAFSLPALFLPLYAGLGENAGVLIYLTKMPLFHHISFSIAALVACSYDSVLLPQHYYFYCILYNSFPISHFFCYNSFHKGLLCFNMVLLQNYFNKRVPLFFIFCHICIIT